MSQVIGAGGGVGDFLETEAQVTAPLLRHLELFCSASGGHRGGLIQPGADTDVTVHFFFFLKQSIFIFTFFSPTTCKPGACAPAVCHSSVPVSPRALSVYRSKVSSLRSSRPRFSHRRLERLELGRCGAEE